jgi:hypothetical protein
MNDDGDSLLFPRRTKPDDFKDYTSRIIWQMRNGYRRHFGIIELPPELKKSTAIKLKVRTK